MPKKLLVIGLGFLGSSIYYEAVKLGFDVIGTNHLKTTESMFLEIADESQIRDVINKIKPEYVINCAARTDIDYLETNHQIATQVNVIGPRNIAKICNENDIRLVHVSTDSVFDGTKGNYSEKDIPSPINVYARSKYEGEFEVIKNSKNYAIVRTNFYGVNKRGDYFFNWILNSLKTNSQITGYTDVIFSPLDVQTLSKMILEILTVNYNGTIHLSSGKPISKFDFIVQVAKKLDKYTDNIKQGKQFGDPKSAPRPKNTSLSNELAKKLIKTQIPDLSTWIDHNKVQIDKYLK
jgi:dTDP-4-dehydrorhamnose reductase